MTYAQTFVALSTCCLAGAIGSLFQRAAAAETRGTIDNPIVDSAMTEQEAFDGLSPLCPKEIRDRQKIVTIKYYSFDKLIHQGQLVIDRDLVADIKQVFDVALKTKFPIHEMIPISHKQFRKDGVWDDHLSMAANNTSAFNYRNVAGTTRLSNHAYGRAIDINTVQNPFIEGEHVSPPGAKYDLQAPGTCTPDSPVTKAFLDRGWTWGGNWHDMKDYQHFEKPTKKK
jgi:hypothetical protein